MQLLVTAGLLICMGVANYGEWGPTQEGLQPQTAGQTTRAEEAETTQTETEEAKGGSGSYEQRGKEIAASGAEEGINGTIGGTTHRETAGGEVQGRLESGAKDNESLADTEPRATGASNEAAENKPSPSDNEPAMDNNVYLGTFTVTAYTAGAESTGKAPGDAGYGITYSGEPVEEGVTAAGYLPQLPLGTVVYIDGVGERVIQDKGSAITQNDLDLFIDDLEEARNWGKQQREVWVVEWGEGA